ncbi:cysteine--tRNA ligase [Candidatus Woesearchaeota archaeon]|nr:MAG: cysteine--tRNA ligase [Candidatus Woesearchaeota archaeon]
MTIRFFNTLSRKKEEFKPLKNGKVGLYTCGPTVYGFVHIGNLRTFMFEDLLRRFLEYKGFEVKHVMNLTDIDDKTIRDSGKEGISLKDFTERYTAEFYKDIDTLKIERATVYPKATEYVDDMIEMTRTLVKKGFAYVKSGSVYYDISKFKGYGKLSHIKVEELKAGARVDVDEYDKDSPQDFALMKKSTLDELKRGIFYETEWGNVRPGWHIECSVMSIKNLGETFDIHTGGVDNIFPHHENEIAQSEAATGKKFVNYWLHSEHLIVDGKKMSKSLGNFYTLRDLLVKGFKPDAIRFVLLATHYRQQLNFTFEKAKDAERIIQRFHDFMIKLEEADGEENANVLAIIEKHKNKFDESLEDDLNISEALAAVFELMNEINKLMAVRKLSKKNAEDVKKTMLEFDRILDVIKPEKEKVPIEVQELARLRQKTREMKKWDEADDLRRKILEHGWLIEDKSDGSFRLKKV